MLSKSVDENQKDWDLYLPLLMMAYRSSVHESTGFSLNEMMLGCEVQRFFVCFFFSIAVCVLSRVLDRKSVV